MLRPALTAGLIVLALAAPAVADGDPDPRREVPAGYGRARAGDEPARRLAVRHVRGTDRPGLERFRGAPVRPVTYGETDGAVFHAWLPRNTNLPIYNIPTPYFPEP